MITTWARVVITLVGMLPTNERMISTMGRHNSYLARDGVDDTLNEEEFCNVDNHEAHFLQYPPLDGNVDNQGEPFPQPLLFSHNKSEGDRDFIGNWTQPSQ
jgi:hypothetical protein